MWSSAAPPVLLSPEAALSWEFWNRYRRQLPLILLGLCLFPILCGLFQQAVVFQNWRILGQWTEAPPMSAMVHFAIVLITLAGVPLVMTSLPPVARHHLLPLATRRLTALRWGHGAVAAALQTGLVSLVARFVIAYGNWPVLEPVAYAVLTYAVAMWIAVRFRGREWWIGGLGAVAAAVMIRLVRRHFPSLDINSDLAELFLPMSLRELACVATGVAAFWTMTQRDAEFDRCQSRLVSAFGAAAADSAVARRPRRKFHSAFGALLSWEWRRNGWLYGLAVGVAVTAVFSLFIYDAASEFRRHGLFRWNLNLSELFAFGLGAISVGPFALIVTTAAGRRVLAGKGTDAWPLTLPLSNRQLGYAAVLRAILSVTFAGLLAVAVGAAFLGGSLAWLRLSGHTAVADEVWSAFTRGIEGPLQLRTQAVFMLITGWTLCGILESAILTGRRAVAGLPHMLLVSLWFFACLLSMFPRFQYVPNWALLAPVPILSCAAVWYAVHVGELGVRGVVACAAMWLGTALFVDLVRCYDLGLLQAGAMPMELLQSDASRSLILACSATMLPIALPPLAVRWNRSR